MTVECPKNGIAEVRTHKNSPVAASRKSATRILKTMINDSKINPATEAINNAGKEAALVKFLSKKPNKTAEIIKTAIRVSTLTGGLLCIESYF